MNNFMYVVALADNHDYSVECIIKSMDDLDKARDFIKKYHGVEFEEVPSRFTGGWWTFDNITDDRDITLVVERVYIVE